jgi:peptide/nickel transport system substrate-binding protein
MKSIRWQLIIILVAGLLVGALLLSGQSGFRLISPAPAKGGSYTEALIGGLQRLNPLLDYYNQPDRDVDRLIFSGLLRFDSHGLPQPDLAEKWGVSMDGLVYNFDIQPKAVWHDGTPVTSADIVFTVDKMRDPASVLPEDLKTFWKGVEVIPLSEKSFQFQLTEPFAPFQDYLTFGILPKHLLGTFNYNDIVNASFNLQPVGSGPYRFEKLIVENGEIKGVVLHSNENFYGQVPFISQMAFLYYADSQTAFTAYQQGDVQGMGEVNLDILPQALANPNLSIYSGRKPEVSMVLFNLNNSQVKFFQDKVVRHALLTGLNRRGMIDKIFNGQGVIASVPLLPDTWAYYDGLTLVDYDSQKAIDALKQDGYVMAETGGTVRKKDGTALSFELLYPQDDAHQAIAEAIQADWAKIGVEVTLKPVAYDLLVLDHLQPLNYEAALVDIDYFSSPDPDPYPFWDISQKSGGQNYSQWENRIASEYLEQARVSQDFAERAKLYRNFQVIFTEDLPALPLFYPIYNYGVDNSIQGVRMGPLFEPSDRFFNVNNWFLVSK